MKTKIKVFLLLFAIIHSFAFSQKKYINRAENAIYLADYKKAEQMYLKALEKNPNSLKANKGIGVLYVEYMEKENVALPYLEKAVSLTSEKMVDPTLYFAIAKSHHYLSNYSEALNYYLKMKNFESVDNDMFQPELNKRIADCEYAMAAIKNNSENKSVYVVNMGDKINTNKPEYVPVLVNDEKLIFTSKRKDSKKEKINPANGDYYESMYITEMKSGYPSVPQLYTIPQTQLKFKNINDNEAVVSAITDNKIYIYSNRKLYEGDLNTTSEKPFAISPVINFDSYQNHASISKDGKMLYFTSESNKGFGGLDIYSSTKNSDGTWGTPTNLGETINTLFDEEAPYISNDGKTLYFASMGHPGFGGFDIYKTTLQEDGKWSTPVNMGMPINSPANDIFYIQNNDQINGYFTSSRDGGFGSLDIYKINYLNKLPDCSSTIAKTLETNVKEIAAAEYSINSTIPDIYKNKVLEYSCMINDSMVNEKFEEYTHKFNAPGTYTLKTKVVAYCDTCLNVLIACNETKIEVKMPEIIVADISTAKGELTNAQLASVGFNPSPLYFNLNEYTLTSEANAIADKNIAILKKYKDLSVVVYAHTDSRGSSIYNKLLSMKRANAVKKYLMEQGIDKRRIDVVGKGESELINACADGIECTEEQHLQNRRAEFKVFRK